MNYIDLGKTGLKVSAVSIGTVSLGVDYGIQMPRQYGVPSESETIRLLQKCIDAGINLFDTAPAYGQSEALLGKALKPYADRCLIATKVSVPPKDDAKGLLRSVENAIDRSLKTLRREVLDIVQIHNATEEIISQGEMAEALTRARNQGKIRFIGASVYTRNQALAVIRSGCFDALQVPYSVLDQQMTPIFREAEARQTGALIRSVLLKGALTIKAQWMPPDLKELQRASERAMTCLAGSWEKLPVAAIRFALSASPLATVLVGVRSEIELNQALEAALAGPLSPEAQLAAKQLAVCDEKLLNPVNWSIQ